MGVRGRSERQPARHGGGATHGPFGETKGIVGEFWIIEAPDLEVALRLATQGSKACDRRIEVRPILEG